MICPRSRSKGWTRNFEVNAEADNNMELSHLQYAYDTLIFCDADVELLRVLRIIFIIFESFKGFILIGNELHIYS